MKGYPWTQKQLDLLRAQYAHQRTTDLAQTLGVPLQLVYSKAGRLGLRKSAEFWATSKSGRILKGGKFSQATQYVPGQKPWNAGRKGWQAGGRSVGTQFTAGITPPNTRPVGSYRVVTSNTQHAQLEQKIGTESGPNHLRWKAVHRLVWEAANGPVPAGHICIFKRGCRTLVLEDITLDKVECISRGENANRNHPNRSNPEVAKLIQLKGAITRQVNRINRETQEQHAS